VSDAPAWEWQATGTRWRLHHDGGVDAGVASAVAAAVAADDARWSRFRADSELSAINARAGAWSPATPETFELLEACTYWHDATGGVFNALVGEALVRWGYARSLAEGPAYAATSPVARPVTARIEIDPARRAVRIPTGTSIDTGGIGKGWIARRAATVLVDAGVLGERLLVDAGGDLLAVRGSHRVAIDRGGAGPRWVELHEEQGVATSGDASRHWRNGDGVSAHHLIDPVTGAPGDVAQATVVADDVVAADVWAKVLALRPHLVEQAPHAALVLQRGGGERTSATWREADQD